MRKNYSRLASAEEKRNVRSAIKFVLLTIIALGALLFFGIPTLGKFAAFISDLAKSEKSITKKDITPPAPPQINTLPEFTNQEIIKITGRSEEGAIIKLSLNNKEKEVVANSDGEFSTDFPLDRKENTLSAFAVDSSGNESVKTQIFKIIFDNEDPELIIDSPQDGSSFSGVRQRQVDIKGSVDNDSVVTINERFVVIESDGKFQFTTTLNEGGNKFTVKASDEAGNMAEKDLVFSFTP